MSVSPRAAISICAQSSELLFVSPGKSRQPSAANLDHDYPEQKQPLLSDMALFEMQTAEIILPKYIVLRSPPTPHRHPQQQEQRWPLGNQVSPISISSRSQGKALTDQRPAGTCPCMSHRSDIYILTNAGAQNPTDPLQRAEADLPCGGAHRWPSASLSNTTCHS